MEEAGCWEIFLRLDGACRVDYLFLYAMSSLVVHDGVKGCRDECRMKYNAFIAIFCFGVAALRDI